MLGAKSLPDDKIHKVVVAFLEMKDVFNFPFAVMLISTCLVSGCCHSMIESGMCLSSTET